MTTATWNDFGVPALSLIAGGTVAKNRLVKFDSTEGRVVHATAITDKVIGVSLNGGSEGDQIAVQIFGVAKVEVGTGGITLAAGAMPVSAEDGKVGTAAGATAHSCGVAKKAGSAGEVTEILLAVPAVNRAPNS